MAAARGAEAELSKSDCREGHADERPVVSETQMVDVGAGSWSKETEDYGERSKGERRNS